MSSPPATRPRWARPCLARLRRLGFTHRILAKLYRASLPRAYKHLAPLGPRFHLQGSHPDLERDLVLDHRILGQTQSLAPLQGRYRGQALFLLGTGPSIKSLDLERLQGHPLMGVNGAIAVMQDEGLTPRHYTITDVDFFENRFDMVRHILEQTPASCFFSAAGFRVIAERQPGLLARDHLYLSEVVNRPSNGPRRSQSEFLDWARRQPDLILPTPERSDDSRVGWSWDLRHGVFCSRTILFRALQIAAFLGYQRLYVLGMDLNYQGPEARAYHEGSNARPSKIERDFAPYILPAFEVLQSQLHPQRLQVFNLSDQSRLPAEVIPRLTFEEALKREAISPPPSP